MKKTQDLSSTIEKVTSMGTVIRLKLEPLANKQVKILEYSRKGKHSQSFKRVKAEEDKVIAFAQLNLEKSFEDLFSAKEAA